MAATTLWERIGMLGVIGSVGSAAARLFGIDPEIANTCGIVSVMIFLGGVVGTMRAIRVQIDELPGKLAVADTTELPDRAAAMSAMAAAVGRSKRLIQQLAPALGVQRSTAAASEFETAIKAACKRGVHYDYLGNFDDPARHDRLEALRAAGIDEAVFEAKHVAISADAVTAAISVLIIDDKDGYFVIPRSGSNSSFAFLHSTNRALLGAFTNYFNRAWDRAAPVPPRARPAA